jgi:hypothetical protein
MLTNSLRQATRGVREQVLCKEGLDPCVGLRPRNHSIFANRECDPSVSTLAIDLMLLHRQQRSHESVFDVS